MLEVVSSVGHRWDKIISSVTLFENLWLHFYGI